MAASSRILCGQWGFSLRSKNLIRNIGKFLQADDLNRAEDAVICRYLRARLEDEIGIQFASKEMAKLFSYEMVGPERPTFWISWDFQSTSSDG